MLLRYSFQLESEAAGIETAISAVLDRGYRTVDLVTPGQTPVSTSEMGHQVVEAVKESASTAAKAKRESA